MDVNEIQSVKCPFCGALPGKKCVTNSGSAAKAPHGQRKLAAQKRSQPKQKVQQPLTQTLMNQEPSKEQPQKLFNHIALIVDASGSMNYLETRTREVFNEQLENIKKNAIQSGQETRISVYRFGGTVSCIQHEMPPSLVQQFTRANYRADMGMTALMDAVAHAIEDGSKIKQSEEKNHSFLIITITDGQENSSRCKASQIQQMIRQKQSTDRWTFAFLVPRGDAQHIQQYFGAYAGNIQEWTQTERGLEQAGQAISRGIGDYYTLRSSGKGSSKSFFANLSNVSDADLNNCDDISGKFLRWKVDHDISIREFVENKCAEDNRVEAKIGGFQAGKGYYQLTKSELVQEYKDFVIMDKKTGAIFGGDHARSLAGIPLGARVRVRPGQFGNLDLFILSTSQNRRLMNGTTFLYRCD